MVDVDRMNLGDMYPTILTLIMVTILLGVGLTVLAKLEDTADVSPTTSAAINDSISALDDFVPWFVVFVVIIASAIIIGMVVRSYGGRG